MITSTDLQARRERAEVVRATYRIEEIQPGVSYYVQHPTEDERAYVVDLAQRECDCPDFTCRMNLRGGMCKHLVCIDELFNGGRLLAEAESKPFLKGGRPTDDAGFTAVRDADHDDDPFTTELA